MNLSFVSSSEFSRNKIPPNGCFQPLVHILISFVYASILLQFKITVLESYFSIFSVILPFKIESLFLPIDANLDKFSPFWLFLL